MTDLNALARKNESAWAIRGRGAWLDGGATSGDGDRWPWLQESTHTG